jgi:hypothetical protein
MKIDRLYILTSMIPYIISDKSRCFSEESQKYILDNLEDIAMMADAWKQQITDFALASFETEESERFGAILVLAFALRQLEVTHKALVANGQLDELKNNLDSITVFDAVDSLCGYAIHKEIIKTTCSKALEMKTPWSIKCNRVCSQLEHQAEYLNEFSPLLSSLESDYEKCHSENVTAEELDKILRKLH